MKTKQDTRIIACRNESELTIDKAATYSIRIVGYLDEKWSERLGGLKIVSTYKEGQKTISMLSGPLVDQAALFGVLNSLYDMRLPLLTVECLEINEN
jgi:hypothetical protein